MSSKTASPALLLRSLLILSLAAASIRASAVPPSDASSTSAPQTIPGLGTTSFPTSTRSPAAQTAFLRGLLLLHLFEYTEAAEAFVAAEKLDPTFALAFWGEAMTSNHGVWNQLDIPAGKAALYKFATTPAARAARILDPRERAYMAAVELLYDDTGTKPEHDRRYAKAMEQLSAAYPADRNAQLFYALALLGQSEGVRDVPVYLHAAEIAKTIFHLEPTNPGAAHYWIHGMDDPAHAAGALPAARAFSLIAPDASHAQHMCSHIFMALGMWDDVVQANVEAMRVDNRDDQTAGFPVYACGHYAEWLEYGYFQQGRFHEAQVIVAACRQTVLDALAWTRDHSGQPPFRAKSPAGLQRRLVHSASAMHDVAVVESQDWTAATNPLVETAKLTPDTVAWSSFTAGFAAAQRGDLPAARSALAAMNTQTEALRFGKDADREDLQALAVGTGELSGLIEVKDGHDQAGLTDLRNASEVYRRMAFAFGPPITIKPPEELLGEVLLAKQDAAAARHAFTQSLERAPGRTQSLLGFARSERLAGDEPTARTTYAKLLAIWHSADADTPGLGEARQSLAAVSNR